MLEFSLKSNYENANTPGDYGYASGLAPNGDVGTSVIRYLSLPNVNYGIGASSIYHLDILGLKNSFVSLAALYQSDHSVDSSLYNFPSGTANIFDGQAALNKAFGSLLTGTLFPFIQDTKAKTLTISAQSLFQLTDPLALLFGVSYSKPDVTQINNGTAQSFSLGGQTSYRAGLTYELLPGTNAYLSFSQSFNPQLLFALNNAVLPPVTGEQYEGGVKYRSAEGRLLLTAALFEINEKNLAGYDTSVNGIDYYKPIGKVTHKGVELQALGQLTRQWQINAGYAYLEPKITGAVTLQAATVDQTELYQPEQTVSLYSTYTFEAGVLRGLSVGTGARYVSAQRTSYANPLANVQTGLNATKDLPGYTLVDATASYSIRKWLLQINAHNIFDKHYFLNTYQTLFYGNAVGDPANVAFSVRRQF
jgi:iron complex outermembrane receptor protein